MSDQKPSLLWHSNSPTTATGYGSQTALFAPGLSEQYNLGISAFYGVEGSPIRWNDIPVYPGIGSTYGNETIVEHARVHFDGELRGGLVVTLMDVWVLNPQIWRQLNLACWVPVDHEPCPPPVAEVLHASLAVPIAMSRFGETQLRNAGLDPLYVPHAVDCDIYRPHDKRQVRDELNMPADAFIVGVVAANKGNPSRKCFPEIFQAFKALREKHSDAVLYLHTELSGKFNGVELPELIDACGLPRESVMFVDQYRAVHYPYPPDKMARIFSCFDVLLCPSAGEGFGIPVLEANACGVPAIVSDFSAQPEVCGAGWVVEGTRHYTPLKAWQFHPSVPDIVDALEQAYDASDSKRDDLSTKGRQHALAYDLPVVLEDYMLPALREAERRFEDRSPVELRAAA